MKKTLIILSGIAALIACNPAKEPKSTIDSALQTKVDSILQNKMTEINAHKGQVIVMEVQTGEIKTMVGLERNDSAFVSYEYEAQASGLMSTVSVLAALETGKVKLSDKVDVGEGIYDVNGLKLRDHNWHRGGYGVISVNSVMGTSSNIGVYKTVKNAFSNDEQAYFDMVKKMGYTAKMITPKDSVWNNTSLAISCLGYNQEITPMQMLTFYNAIANDGVMVKPLFFEDSVVVMNPQIADKANVDSMQLALTHVVSEGLGRRAHSDKVQVAGKTGTIVVAETDGEMENNMNIEYAVEFCGFFPVDNPKYSVIVTMNKMGLPASGGGMAGDVFKQVVERIGE